MVDPALMQIMFTTMNFGVCGSLVGVAMRYMQRDQPGPRLDQAAAVGFLIGAGWGAFYGIFQSLLAGR